MGLEHIKYKYTHHFLVRYKKSPNLNSNASLANLFIRY